jgi:Cbb3-type cytochrome oxidase, subunit 1
MLVPVWGGSANFLLTMRGQMGAMAQSYPLMFIFVGVIGYLVGSTQGTFEAFRSLQEVWHLTNFTVGHSHLTMYGFVTFAIWAAHTLLPLATGKEPSPLRAHAALLDGVSGELHLHHLAVRRRHDSGAGLDSRPAVHTVGGGYAGVLGLARRRRLAHVSEPPVFAWNVWRMTYGVGANASLRDASPTAGAGG